MVHPTPYMTNYSNILKVSFTGDNIIKDMPRFECQMCPSNLVNFLLKNSVVNNQFEFSAEMGKAKTITVHLT